MTIVEDTGAEWNKRLGKCMGQYSEGRLSQQALADKLGTSQKTVFKWLHVGQASKGETYRFPRYETMQEIARFFGVQVGYLTGETDCKTFEMEDAVAFTGLTEAALEKIRLATRFKTAFRSVEMMDDDARKAISAFIEADGFFGLIAALEELDRAYSDTELEGQTWADLENKYGASLLNKALDFDPYCEEAFAANDDPRLADAYREVQKAMDGLHDHGITNELIIEAMRYRITMQFAQIVAELHPRKGQPPRN